MFQRRLGGVMAVVALVAAACGAGTRRRRRASAARPPRRRRPARHRSRPQRRRPSHRHDRRGRGRAQPDHLGRLRRERRDRPGVRLGRRRSRTRPAAWSRRRTDGHSDEWSPDPPGRPVRRPLGVRRRDDPAHQGGLVAAVDIVDLPELRQRLRGPEETCRTTPSTACTTASPMAAGANMLDVQHRRGHARRRRAGTASARRTAARYAGK